MEERIRKRVVGQDHVIKPIVASVQHARAGLSDPTKPIGAFLLIGDSGVGKTEMAKALAHEIFHHEKFLITTNMMEYSDDNSISKLLGAPGYISYFLDKFLFFFFLIFSMSDYIAF